MNVIINNFGISYKYFGARYYNSDISVWLSVDPLSDFRQGLSPYNYVQWNPSNRIDPSGMLDFKGGPGKKGKRPRNKRFRMNNRKFTGRNLRWKGSRGTSSPPVTKLNSLKRNLGLTNRIATVPMGRYRTSPWTNVQNGGAGITNISFSPQNSSSYRLRNFRINGPGSGFFITSITTNINGRDRLFGFDASLRGPANGMGPGFFPLLNPLLTPLFPLSVVPLFLNTRGVNPRYRNTSSWIVNRRGWSNNLNYTVQIRFRQWQSYEGIRRPFWHSWFYGLN